MIFLDSWIWIEYFSEGKKLKESEALIKNISKNEGCVINPLVIAEVKYKIAKNFDIIKANKVIYIIENLPNLHILPITIEIAKLAVDLRLKYYHRKNKDLSYVDVMNLATAILSNCKTLYSGDPDFKDIEEIKTVVV